MTEDEMVGWHHCLDGLEYEQTPDVGEGHGRLMCCSLRGREESDMTEQQQFYVKMINLVLPKVNTQSQSLTNVLPWQSNG